MIDWGTLKPALTNWWAAATGLTQVVWESDAQGSLRDQHGIISLVSSTPVGVDQVKETYAEAIPPDPEVPEDEGTPARIVREVVGVRTIELNFAADSFSQLPAKWAIHWVERGRARVRFPAILALLRAAGGALVDLGPVVVADYEGEDDRVISRATMRVRINVPFIESDAAGTSDGSFIEHVELTSEVADVDSTLDPDLQLDHEVIP